MSGNTCYIPDEEGDSSLKKVTPSSKEKLQSATPLESEASAEPKINGDTLPAEESACAAENGISVIRALDFDEASSKKKTEESDKSTSPAESTSLRRSSRVSSKEEADKKKEDLDPDQENIKDEGQKENKEAKDVKKGRGKPNSLASPVKEDGGGGIRPLGCAVAITCFLCKDFSSTRKWSLDR